MAEIFQSVASPPTETQGSAEAKADPRTRRTRELLLQALGTLLQQKDFDRISVQDITDAAGVNRATFYAHYPDKFALLECMVADRFHALLDERGITFVGTCMGALRSMVLGVCDFLATSPRAECERQRQMEPHLEAAVVAVVRGMLLGGLREHADAMPPGDAPELRAATISFAIFGAAKEWLRTPGRVSSDEIADTIVAMVAPLMHPPEAPAPPVS